MALIGFGLDYQFKNDYSYGGIFGLISRFQDELTHISIVSLADDKEALDFKKNIAAETKLIHHLSGIEPATPSGPNIKKLIKQSKISSLLNVAWCLEDIGIWSIGPYSIPYFAPPIFCQEIAYVTARNIIEINKHTNAPFLAEIPSCSFVAGDISLGDFFNILVNESKCDIVLDVSHVFSYSLATNQDPISVLKTLPLSSVKEIHIAGGRVNKKFPHRYIDSHSDIIHDVVLKIFNESLLYCNNLQAITYEIGVRSTENLITSDFEKINKIIKEHNFIPFRGD